MIKWEYRVLDSRDAALGDLNTTEGREQLRTWLNEMGEEGWEADSFNFLDNGGHPQFISIARREKRNLLR